MPRPPAQVGPCEHLRPERRRIPAPRFHDVEELPGCPALDELRELTAHAYLPASRTAFKLFAI